MHPNALVSRQQQKRFSALNSASSRLDFFSLLTRDALLDE